MGGAMMPKFPGGPEDHHVKVRAMLWTATGTHRHAFVTWECGCDDHVVVPNGEYASTVAFGILYGEHLGSVHGVTDKARMN